MRSYLASQGTSLRWTSEKAFQASIVKAAKTLQWMVYFTRDSRGSPRGFPDLVMAKIGHPLILAELKLPGRHPSPFQMIWIRVLKGVPGVTVRVWRPQDWDQILETLKGSA